MYLMLATIITFTESMSITRICDKECLEGLYNNNINKCFSLCGKGQYCESICTQKSKECAECKEENEGYKKNR